MKVLISTIFKGDAAQQAIRVVGPEKQYLYGEWEADTSTGITLKNAISKIKDTFKNLQIEHVKTPLYGIPEAVEAIVGIIDKEKGNELKINLTESRKTLSFAGLYAASLRKNLVKGVYYFQEENSKPIQLPLLSFKMPKAKRRVLEQIRDGIVDAVKIRKNVGKGKTIIYKHIKELKQEGYITDKMEITDAGRIALT